ncbi:LOW QUALITY PROTEIN: hypothetical protein Cgig2_007927 [Carnegiea gigantea]|uniref:NB-ARC domain-containing protein n=1 Tax=Carnegiea gigantea TaxID=171969 RepID=A0A9Q1KFU5_9CARY|nr:LOW QUALITY PROTEIN: hypothetical protein Cgig2_007927 [Carnegiea gigantea]
MSLRIEGSILHDHPKILSDCHNLRHLTIGLGDIDNIIAFPQNLVKLRCWHCRFSNETISILEKLPQLKKLSLVVRDDFSYCDLHISSNGFPELTCFVIKENVGVMTWTIESGGLPQFTHLVIKENRGSIKWTIAGIRRFPELQVVDNRGPVEGLKRELEWMKSFLWDGDYKQYKKVIICQWISEIRDLAEEAEDVIELYILKVSHKREKPRGLIPWTDLKWLLCCMRDAKTLHSVGSDIDTLIAKINKLIGRSQRYGITRSNDELIDPYFVFKKRFIDQRQTYSHSEDVIIELNGHVKKVEHQLVNGPQKVVVIHGMGGIGKAALARKVYNHASLKSQFEGKDGEERKLVRELQDSQLPPNLYDVLKRAKCLVVLDDIWLIEDWNCLTHAFPLNDNSCDSRVLVTTHNSQIFSCYPSHMVYYYEAKFLNPNQSWELLEKKKKQISTKTMQQMASFVIESAANWLGKLLVEEVEFLAKVRDKVEGLKRELEWMQSFLWDADHKQYKTAIIRQWISEIRDLAQEAEDVIERYILKVSHKREKPRSLIPWTDLKWLLCCMKDAETLHSVGSDIDAFIAKINELTGRLQRYGITRSNGELMDRYLVFEKRFIDQRRTYSHTEDVVVGLDEHVKEVADQLVNGPQKIVVIHGMGGIGKTTLARKVYNHASLKSQFEGFSWAYVSQQLQLGSVCREILLQLIPTNHKEERKLVRELQDSQLPPKLYDVLKRTKCLVVLDDIWFIKDWNCLKHAFPLNDDCCASKVLVTTRDSQIFSYYPSHVVYYYEAEFLNPSQSWELLEKKANFNKDNAESRMVEVGEKMLKHCNGLPLAIVVLGGILEAKRTVEQWQDVFDNLQSNLEGHGLYSGVYEVLALSYYELSYHLKACFLVLGYFPEDFEIPAQRLYHLWIAEGIMYSRQGREGEKRSLEDIAKVYLNELVHEGMVQVVSRDVVGDIKMCKLHDLMRDKCLQIAKDENFLLTSVCATNHELQQQHPSSCVLNDSIRRLAVHVGDSVLELESLANSTKLPHLKSLLLFRSGEISDYQSVGHIPRSRELLRILDFTDIPCPSLASSIGTLIYLRYLSLKDTGIIELPSEIGNLRSLLILDLRSPRLTLPDVLWKMKSLKQLYLSSLILLAIDSKALHLDKLSHLQIIEGLDLDTTEVKGLQELSTSLSLQRLKATCFDKKENLDPFLKSSTIKSMSLRMGGSILADHSEMLSNCHYLHRLMIVGGSFGDIITLPQNLVKLQFWKCQFSKEIISFLEKLPQLKMLGLLACTAPFQWHLHISSDSFPELTHLVIANNHDLEEWTVESGGLPKLQKLLIQDCELIRKIPDALPPQVSITCDPCVAGIEKYGSCPHYIRKHAGWLV